MACSIAAAAGGVDPGIWCERPATRHDVDGARSPEPQRRVGRYDPAMQRDLPIAIVGAGLGGLVAALALAREGFRRIDVYERSPALGEVGAGLTISPNSSRALIALGLGDGLAQRGDEPPGGMTRHWQTARILMRSVRGQALRDQYGAPYLFIHRADLLDLLVEACAAQPAVRIHTAHALQDITQDAEGVTLAFEGGRSARAALAIGCDGVKSVVRQRLLADDQPQFSGYVAWRALLPVETPADRLDPPAQLFIGVNHLFMRYHIRHGALTNVVAIARANSDWHDEGWTLPSTVEELASHYADWHPDIVRAISRIPPSQCFKWAIHVRPPLERWCAGRVTVAGDAAHPMTPFMGMGAAMAIEDGVVLARACALRPDWASAFETYESLRRPRADFVQTESAKRGLRLMSSDPDSYGQVREVSEDTLGLFAYDAMRAVDGS
jgi:salicylate hydroxylase